MEIINFLGELLSQINIIIEQIVRSGGNWAYLIMFLVLFAGAACVLTAPLLPSVSLIFVVTSLCVAGLLNPFAAYLVLVMAIILGDLTGYFLGKLIGDKLLVNNKLPFIKPSHIKSTRKLYEGADFLTFVLARFTPLIGSFAQMVAGAVNFKLDAFLLNNIISGVIWFTLHFVAGMILAYIPGLKDNFVIMFLIVPILSFLASSYYIVKKSLQMAALKNSSQLNTK
ncbi:MAG: VTT domain-containing protein [Bacillota bacterium]